jgi:hypothetical protein
VIDLTDAPGGSGGPDDEGAAHNGWPDVPAHLVTGTGSMHVIDLDSDAPSPRARVGEGARGEEGHR